MDILKTYDRYSQRGQLRLLLGTMIALVAADGLISRYLVTLGFAREVNPFMQTWVSQSDFVSFKMVYSFMAAFILWRAYKRLPNASFFITVVFVIGYTVLNFWSLYVFLSQI